MLLFGLHRCCCCCCCITIAPLCPSFRLSAVPCRLQRLIDALSALNRFFKPHCLPHPGAASNIRLWAGLTPLAFLFFFPPLLYFLNQRRKRKNKKPGVLWLFIALVSFRKQVIECVTALPLPLPLPPLPPPRPPMETLTVPLQLHSLQSLVRTLSKSVAAEGGRSVGQKARLLAGGTSAAVIPTGPSAASSLFHTAAAAAAVESLSSLVFLRI